MSAPEPPPPSGAPHPPSGWVEPLPGGRLPPPGPAPPPTPPVAPPPPVWAPIEPPPPERHTGLVVGLVLGGLAGLLLLAVGGALLTRNVREPDVAVDPTDTVAIPPRPPTTRGPTTSVAGTGPLSSVTPATAAPLVRDLQQRNYPDLRIGLTTCPPGPYRVGHVVVCRMELEDATVLIRVEVTGDQTLTSVPASPVVDTDKTEVLMEEKEPGATAECGEPRVRQVETGESITCRTGTYTWDFTVGPDGGLTGTTR